MNSSLRFLNFSPNSSRVNSPLAESTAIGSPLGKQIHTSQKRKSISPPVSNLSKYRPNVKIDPQVLIDGQSNGIVSRLVKYYDQSNEADSSRIVYNKFGDFPLVQLRKTELKRPISRSTSVRIAPPNKTIMNPNLRAAIMRRNSFQANSGLPKIAPAKMRPRDDSHKIITNHEPIITDSNYTVSSKSVLDALEKNCRKRISNEELILDRNKKFCAPLVSEVVDSPSSREFIPISSVPQSVSKRTREELSPGKSFAQITDTTNHLSKRVKTKNNALLSSLSSSHYDLIPSISPKIQNNSRISSVPLTPKLITKKMEAVEVSDPKERVNLKIPETKIEESKPPQKKLHLFNAKPDPNAALNRAKLKALESNMFNDDDEDDDVKIRFVKPKEKILENYDVISYIEKDKLNKMLKGLSQGIKSPVKETPEVINKGNDVIDSKTIPKEQTVPQQASISFTTSTTSSTIAPISTPASTSSAVISINPVISTSATTDKKDIESSKENKINALPTTTASVSVSESSIPKPSFQGGFQFGLTSSDVQKSIPSTTTAATIIAPFASTNKPVSPLAFFSAPKTDAAATPIDKPLISFTPLKPTETSSAPSSNATTQLTLSLPSTTVVSTAAPVFGASTVSSGFKFGESAAPKEDSNKNSVGFTFGNTANTANDKNEKPLGFSFGTSTTSNPLTTTSTPSFGANMPKIAPTTSTPIISFQNPATTTNAPVNSNSNNMFSFGGGNSANQSTPPAFGIASSITSNQPSFTKPETTVASGVGFSFGSKPSTGFSFGSTSQVQPVSTQATTTPTFSFGASNPVSSTTTSGGIFSPVATTTAPSFSFGSNTAGTQNTNTGFSGFGATSPPKTEAPSAMFSFGQKPQTAPVVATTKSSGFSFGTPSVNSNNSQSTLSANQPLQNSGFSFGQTANSDQNKTTGIFSRLGDKPLESKTFSFGGSNNNSNNLQPAPSFGSSNPVLGASNNLFGSSSTVTSSATSSVFGQNTSIGNTGGNLFSSVSNNNSTNQAVVSPFGSASQTPQSGNNLFAFGSTTTNNNNNINNSGNNNNNTSSNQPQSGIFGFGGSNANNSTMNSPQNIFGSSTNNGQNVSASFTFNTTTGNITQQQPQNASSPFNQNSAAPPPYQFGSTGSNNVSASFTFSGASSTQQQQPASAPTPSSGPMFNFGNTTPAEIRPFNFQGQPQSALPQASPAAGNLFNIGTGGNQQRRMARVATRRYK